MKLLFTWARYHFSSALYLYGKAYVSFHSKYCKVSIKYILIQYYIQLGNSQKECDVVHFVSHQWVSDKTFLSDKLSSRKNIPLLKIIKIDNPSSLWMLINEISLKIVGRSNMLYDIPQQKLREVTLIWWWTAEKALDSNNKEINILSDHSYWNRFSINPVYKDSEWTLNF